MSKFQGNDFNIRDEDGFSSAPRVVKTAQPVERTVQEFKLNNLNDGARRVESAPKSQRASGGETALGRDHQRFVMSQLARDALSIGKEEERVIELRVQEKLSELSKKTEEAAFKKGHEEGLKLGHDEAFQAFQSESSERLQQFQQLLQSMENAKSELFEANREFLMNVIYRVAKSVLLREIATDKEYLLRLSRDLIERSGLRENLTVKIHPSDAQSLEMIKQGLAQSFSSLRNLSIELSDHVERGGCVLETEWGAIDASLETQLSQILQTLDVAKGTTA